jgi:hypothetical protein
MKDKLLVLIHIRSNELINISIILILLWNRGLTSIIDIVKFSLSKITKKTIFLNKFHGNSQQPPPRVRQLTFTLVINQCSPINK